jgi:hypothetical protein
MYDRAVKTVCGLSSEAQGLFRDQLAEIVSSSRGILISNETPQSAGDVPDRVDMPAQRSAVADAGSSN